MQLNQLRVIIKNVSNMLKDMVSAGEIDSDMAKIIAPRILETIISKCYVVGEYNQE